MPGVPSAKRAYARRSLDPRVVAERARWAEVMAEKNQARWRADVDLAISVVLAHPEVSAELHSLLRTVRYRREAGDELSLWTVAERLGKDDLADKIWDTWFDRDAPPREGPVTWAKKYLFDTDTDVREPA